MSFIRTGLRELGLKVRRQRTRMALRRQRRVLQRAEIALGREGVEQAGNFPELRNEIVALKKLEQEQKEVAAQIAQIEERLRELDTQRKQNAEEQSRAIAELEAQKKPLVHQRDEARAASDLCDRELTSVEKRLQQNDAADRELLDKLTALHALTPPPDDLDAQSAILTAHRARLPDERAGVMQARLGAEEACRSAKEKVSAVDQEIRALDAKIAAVRAEHESRDRALNETSRAQQEALKEARGRHQTVEERKNPAYLNIGRHLALQSIAPPNSPHLLTEVHRHREISERHAQHAAHLAELSQQIDRQELRRFYFSSISVVVLLAIVGGLLTQTPPKRDWLPQETDAILSINTEQLERDDLPRRWRKDQPQEWQRIYDGLLTPTQKTPELNIPRDTLRVTRATQASGAGPREFILIDARNDLARVLRGVEHDRSFTKRTVSGLPVWQRPDLAIARVGPKTLAVGNESEVEELVRVRLGMETDLKITGQMWERFQALNQGIAVRLISRDPPHLQQAFRPIFAPELLERVQLLGLGLTLQNPVRARMILKTKTADEARALAVDMRAQPQRWLHIVDSPLNIFAQTADVQTQDTNVEIRCDVPENSARLLLQRIAKIDAPPQIAEQ